MRTFAFENKSQTYTFECNTVQSDGAAVYSNHSLALKNLKISVDKMQPFGQKSYLQFHENINGKRAFWLLDLNTNTLHPDHRENVPLGRSIVSNNRKKTQEAQTAWGSGKAATLEEVATMFSRAYTGDKQITLGDPLTKDPK